MSELGPAQAAQLIREYLDAGRVKEAMVVAKRAIDAFSPGLEFRVLFAQGLVAHGQKARARQVLEGVLRLDGRFLPALALLARLEV